MFWTITGWIIALLSLLVNLLQLFKNSKLKKEINKTNFIVDNNSAANLQEHSGIGNNINVSGNIR